MSTPSQAVAIRSEQAIAEPYRVPLPEVQLPEVGRLRLGGPMEPIIDRQTGAPRLGRDGRTPVMKMGRPLDFFRATAAIREDLEELARVYGNPDAIEPWEAPDGQQWQTVLTQSVLHIALPPYSDTLVGPRYETYNAGHYMTRHCDGRTCWVPIQPKKDGNRVIEPGRWEPRRCICSPDSPECAQVTRLKVVVLGVPAHGVWRVECHGAYAARHWPAQVQMAQDLTRDGRPVPATIRIESKVGRSAVFGKSNYKVPVLRLEEAFVLSIGEGKPLIEGPRTEAAEQIAPTCAAPEEPIPPDDDAIDVEATVTQDSTAPVECASEALPSGQGTEDTVQPGDDAAEPNSPAAVSPPAGAAWLDLPHSELLKDQPAYKAFLAALQKEGGSLGAYQRSVGGSIADHTARRILAWASGGEPPAEAQA